MLKVHMHGDIACFLTTSTRMILLCNKALFLQSVLYGFGIPSILSITISI